MLDILFVVLFFTFPFLVIIYMKSIGLSIFTITIPSILILSMFVYAYSGILPLYFGWDEYRYSMGVTNRWLIFEVFIYSCLSIVGLLLGFTYAKYIFKIEALKDIKPIRSLTRKEITVLFLLVLFCFFVLFVYISKIPQIALFVAINSGINEAKLARSLMGNDFGSKYHWYYVIFHHLFIFLTFALFSAHLLMKKKIVLFLFIIAFLGSSFAAVMATEKAPFAGILIGLFLTYALTKLKGKIPIKATIFFFTVLFSVLILFYIFFMGSSDSLSALSSVFSRALSGSIQPAYYYLEFFPSHQDFLMGRSFPNPGGIFPFEPYRMTVEVMNWVNPNDNGIVGSMPTVFWSEAYANFGIFGILFIPFIVGVFVYMVHYVLSKLENTPIKIAFSVWLILHIKTLSITGFSGFFIDFYLIMITFIIMSTIAITNKFKIKYYKKRMI